MVHDTDSTNDGTNNNDNSFGGSKTDHSMPKQEATLFNVKLDETKTQIKLQHSDISINHNGFTGILNLFTFEATSYSSKTVDSTKAEPDKRHKKDETNNKSKLHIDKCNIHKDDDDDDTHNDVDRGYAFVILAVMFIINASTYGTARAYGFIFEKLARDDDIGRSEAAIPFTIMGALENMSGPLAGYILARTQSWRLTVLTGSMLITSAHLLSAIFDSLAGRIVTMGIIGGFGMSLITISKFQINNAYFVRYRSRAFGFCLTGAAFGTLYISPICRYILNEYSINYCYLILGIILFPNVPLSLLLRPKSSDTSDQNETDPNDLENSPKDKSLAQTKCSKCLQKTEYSNPTTKATKATKTSKTSKNSKSPETTRPKDTQISSVWCSIKQVLSSPIFHMIWPTQLLFYWFNFVFGMIIVDFGKDRGLNEDEVTNLVPTWAFGQLVGRLFLGALVDMNFISCKLFTVICLASISLSTWALNNLHMLPANEGIILISLFFILSMFTSNLYILFNSLISIHIERRLTAMAIGISSFLGSFFLLPRAHVIGYYRDTEGNYDSMLDLFSYISAVAALIWLVIALVCR